MSIQPKTPMERRLWAAAFRAGAEAARQKVVRLVKTLDGVAGEDKPHEVNAGYVETMPLPKVR